MHAVSVPPLAGAAGGDTATNERLRMLGMTRRFPHPLRMSLPLPSVVLVVVHALQRDPQPRGNFFLDANDRFRLRRFLWSRRVSRSNSAMRVSFGGAFGPRFTDPVPAPAAPCRRQVLRLDEYILPAATRLPPRPHSCICGFTHDSALILATESTPCRGPQGLDHPQSDRPPRAQLQSPYGRPAVPRDASFSASLITNTGYRPSRPAH